MKNDLKKLYFDFVDELDPYRDEEDPKTLKSMLYNLLAIKDDWTELDPELMEMLDNAIEQFKAHGVKCDYC